MQRWQEPKPLHETGEVSPVPFVNSRTLRQPGRANTLTKLDRHHKSEAKNIAPELQTHGELRMRDFNDELNQLANHLQERVLLSTAWTAELSGTVRWTDSVPAKSCG